MKELTKENILNYKKIKEVKELITEKQILQIENVCRFYNNVTIGNRVINLYGFILNGVQDRWVGRLRIIQRKLKKDVLSEFANKIRYGCNWEKKRDELKNKVKMNLEKFIELYGEEEGKKSWELRNERTKSYGEKYMVARYGEEEGKKKWEKTLSSKIATMQERKKIKPYRNGRTLKEYQNRFGEEEGNKRWMDRNKRQSYLYSREYFNEKCGEEGDAKWREYKKNMNKTSRQSFINRYGEVEGIKKYNQFVDKMKFTNTIEYFNLKYGEEGLQKYQDLILSKIKPFDKKWSKVSQELFWEISKNIDIEKCYFGELNDEYKFYIHQEWGKIIMVDFKYGNKIIEFDGDFWHSSDRQKNIDKMRDEYLIGKGYDIFRVKEGEYYKNKQLVVEQCLTFLKNEK